MLKNTDKTCQTWWRTSEGLEVLRCCPSARFVHDLKKNLLQKQSNEPKHSSKLMKSFRDSYSFYLMQIKLYCYSAFNQEHKQLCKNCKNSRSKLSLMSKQEVTVVRKKTSWDDRKKKPWETQKETFIWMEKCPSIQSDMWEVLQEAWSEISSEFFNKLTARMPKGLQGFYWCSERIPRRTSLTS